MEEKLVHGTCADLAQYYNIYKCCISGDIGTDNHKAHSNKTVIVQTKM